MSSYDSQLSAARDTIARLTRERDEARASLKAAEAELHRLTCGVPDGLCPYGLAEVNERQCAEAAEAEVERLRAGLRELYDCRGEDPYNFGLAAWDTVRDLLGDDQ